MWLNTNRHTHTTTVNTRLLHLVEPTDTQTWWWWCGVGGPFNNSTVLLTHQGGQHAVLSSSDISLKKKLKSFNIALQKADIGSPTSLRQAGLHPQTEWPQEPPAPCTAAAARSSCSTWLRHSSDPRSRKPLARPPAACTGQNKDSRSLLHASSVRYRITEAQVKLPSHESLKLAEVPSAKAGRRSEEFYMLSSLPEYCLFSFCLLSSFNFIFPPCSFGGKEVFDMASYWPAGWYR